MGEDAERATIPTNEYTYSLEYFTAQVLFAQRWAQVAGISLDQAFLDRTALYKTITGHRAGVTLDSDWQTMIGDIRHDMEALTISNTMYKQYTGKSFSRYTPEGIDERHFGFFGFDYYPDNLLNSGKNTIKVHFINSKRGAVSALDKSYTQQRRQDVKRMMEFVREHFPEAAEVVGGSWLYTLPLYKDSFPPEFTRDLKRLVPPGFEKEFLGSVPNMRFDGDSVWGQFMNRYGWVRQKAYNVFANDVAQSKTEIALLDAFPHKTLLARAPVSTFFDWSP